MLNILLSVKGCQELLNTDSEHISDLTDPLVVVFDASTNPVTRKQSDTKDVPILKTPVVQNTCLPTWDEESASVEVCVSSASLFIFQVWHQFADDKKGTFLGEAQITGDSILAIGRSGQMIEPLLPRVKEPNAKVKGASISDAKTLGSVRVAWQEVVDKPAPIVPEGTKELGGFCVLNARNVLKRDSEPGQLSDPYAIVTYPNKQRILWRSPLCSCTLNPTWANDVNTAAVLVLKDMPDGSEGVITVEVWNTNPRPERDSFLGMAKIRPSELMEGFQRLHLRPRINEPDSYIAKLAEGRLGWVTCHWAPVGDMLMQCRRRKQDQELGLQRPREESVVREGVEVAPAVDGGEVRPTAIDGSHAAQWTPAQLNEYLKLLRQQKDGPGGAPIALPQEERVGSGQAAAAGTVMSSTATAKPLASLSYFSPYYPHEGDVKATLRDKLTPNNNNPTLSSAPPAVIGDPAAVSMAEGANNNNFSKKPPNAVAVEMTDLIPIRLKFGAVHYDTELHVDSRLSELSGVVQEVFRIHRDVQLFSHHGECKDPRLTLRQNGLLLLKGDPNITLTMSVAKGPMQNLVMVLPDKKEIAMSVGEQTTVWELKKKLCDEYGDDGKPADVLYDPKEMRLLWRYNELNDKATLQYYNVPTNSKITVAKRPAFSFGQRSDEYSDSDEDDRRVKGNGSKKLAGSSHESRMGVERVSSSSSSKRVESAGKERSGSSTKGDKDRPPRGNTVVTATSDRGRSRSAEKKGATTTSSSSRKGKSSSSKEVVIPDPNHMTYTVQNRPRGYYETSGPDAGVDDPELQALRKTVKLLEQQVQMQTAQQQALVQQQYEQRLSKMERELTNSEQRYIDALERIRELEGAVTRYQALLQKAAQITPSPF